MKYDAIVIGAGPAGSSAAEKLSMTGHKTLMIDPCVGKKVCAGVLTARYLRKYGIDDSFVEKKLKGVKISFKGISAKIEYKKAVEYSINRGSYDSFNLDQALGAGALLIKDVVLSLDENDVCVEIRTHKERIRADYAILASGVSDISRLSGGVKEFAYCVQQKKYENSGDYFEMDLLANGYSWTVPKKDHILSGTTSLANYPDIPGERGLIPVNGPVKTTFSKRTLLAGDAAGFVSPFEGEGIYYAKRSGELAASVISDVISGDTTTEVYEKYWRKEFDFSTLAAISRLLNNDIILEAFVREIRDNEKFNKVVENILTKEYGELRAEYISSLIKKLVNYR